MIATHTPNPIAVTRFIAFLRFVWCIWPRHHLRSGSAGPINVVVTTQRYLNTTLESLKLTNTIGKQGGTARRVRVTATVTADKSDAGIKVVSSHLKATVEGLEGVDKTTLGELATGAEKSCPISNAIRGTVAITVEARAV